MPQLKKRGKWVFGWVIVDANCSVVIPPEACTEYGFRDGDLVIFLHGSRRSGGFSLSCPERLEQCKVSMQRRSFALGHILSGRQIALPKEVNLQPGSRLLVVRGSGLALLFITQGPIFDEAKNHLEIECF